jgi:hypothetical protein
MVPKILSDPKNSWNIEEDPELLEAMILN